MPSHNITVQDRQPDYFTFQLTAKSGIFIIEFFKRGSSANRGYKNEDHLSDDPNDEKSGYPYDNYLVCNTGCGWVDLQICSARINTGTARGLL